MNADLRSPAAWLPRTPFWSLVAHFLKRMFSSEFEEGSEGMSLGLGVAFAILASPGAFASIFLLDKYSTLLQWLRGQRNFDFFKASAADEYFFVVLSMTITGLVMVLRWNRLFPDRRDFANLAVLPIPIHHVFLANFVALLGIAFAFAIDVNAVSSVFFPLFVTLADGSIGAFARVAIGHWAAVFSASMFSFFAVFGLVGVLMLLLPARWLRPVSVLLRVLLVVGLFTEFCSNLFLQLMAGRLPVHAEVYMRFLPSFWFLGLYEKVVRIAGPGMAQMSGLAVKALAISIVVAVGAYSLCYRRHFLRLAESFDSLGGIQHGARFRMPAWFGRTIFRLPFEEGCGLFAFKVLLRSERHVMILGGYLGTGLVFVAQTAVDVGSNTKALPDTDLLSIPLLVAFFLISGLRFVFDVPAALAANWIFRASPGVTQPTPESMARRFMYLTVLPWQVLVLAPLAAQRFGWVVAFETVLLDVSFSVLAIAFLFARFRKIAFTYAVEPDSRKMVRRFICLLLSAALLVPMLASIEHWALQQWWRCLFVFVLMLYGLFEVERRKRSEEPALTFEERSEANLELLKLA